MYAIIGDGLWHWVYHISSLDLLKVMFDFPWVNPLFGKFIGGHFLFDHLAHISDDDSNKDDSECAKWCPACFDSAIYFSWFDISKTFLGIIVASDFRKFLLFGTQQKESC